MAKEIKRRPKLRFPEFTDDWEQRKLSELTDRIIVGLATSVTPYYRETGTPLLRNMNIKENYLDDSDILYLDNEYANSNTGKMIHENDVLTVHTGSNIGVTCIAPKKYNGSLSFTTLITTPTKEKLDSLFLMQYMNCNIGKKSIDVLITAGGKPNLNSGDLEKLEVSYPIVDEQKKIGEYFSNLDNLITLRQCELDELKELKKSMLQKMFPKNGEKVPEIRFPEFTGDWEQRKLGDVCSRVQGNDGRMELPTLTISAANGWMKQEDRFSGNIAGKEQKNYTLLHKGELSYNHGNSKLAKYGTVFSLRTYEEALVPMVYHSFKVEIENADFIEYYFATKIPDRELKKLISSGARMDGLLNIGYKDFMGIKIMLPSVSEQVKIAEYFRSLDHLIALHQRELDGYKELKKGLLQQMFC